MDLDLLLGARHIGAICVQVDSFSMPAAKILPQKCVLRLSPQPGVFGFGLLKDRKVRVGVLP